MHSNRWNKLSLAAALLVWALTALAQPTQQLPDPINPGDLSNVVGPPTVQITEVKGATAQGGGFQVRVKWTAQVPSTTKIDKFDLSVSVKDSNGKTNTGVKTVAAAAREALVPVAITAKPGTFQANITTFFVPINQVKVEFGGTILLDKGNGFSDSGSSTGPANPQGAGDSLTKVALVGNTNLKGFDVEWRLRQRTQDVTEKQTKVSGTFTYKKGNQTVGTSSASTTVGGGTRQTRLTVSSAPLPNLENARIEAAIKIEVFFTLLKRLVTTLDGHF